MLNSAQMSFSIRLAQDLTAVDAGATVPLSIEVTNKAEATDRYEMQVEGIDPEWTALPEPVFTVGAHEVHSQKIFFKPPRSSESLAGNYPFVVKVRSLESGDSRTVQGVLEIKAFNHLSIELTPKKGHSTPLRPQFNFTVDVMNLGNTDHTLQLSGADPEEECAYDFGSDQVTVGPGQQKEVSLAVASSNGGWIAAPRLFGFVVNARSIQNPNVMASTQGQLERRPILSLPALLTAAVIAVALLLWIAVRPQPPAISVFVDSSTVLSGQSFHVQWKAQHANSVNLQIEKLGKDGRITTEPQLDLQTDGTREIQAADEDTISVTATAVGDNNRTSPSKKVTISVRPAPEVAKPKILSFKASSRNIKLGEPVLFTFDYSSDVVRLTLSPTNQQMTAPMRRIEDTPKAAGSIDYELFAYNKDNGYDIRKITVNVEQQSEAVITDFSADPPVIVAPASETKVSWNVAKAALVQLDDGTGSGLKTVDASGNIPVIVDRTVTLKLIATDGKNVLTSKKLTIKYKPLPPPTNPFTTNPPSTAGSTAGAGTGGGH